MRRTEVLLLGADESVSRLRDEGFRAPGVQACEFTKVNLKREGKMP